MVYFFVYVRVFFYIQVASGNVGFRLVVVVVRYKIFDGIVREEGLEFAVKLGAQSFVMAYYERGPLHGLDDFRHRESFSAARYALKGLEAVSAQKAFAKFLDGRPLVARKFVWRFNDKFSHRQKFLNRSQGQKAPRVGATYSAEFSSANTSLQS